MDDDLDPLKLLPRELLPGPGPPPIAPRPAPDPRPAVAAAAASRAAHAHPLLEACARRGWTVGNKRAAAASDKPTHLLLCGGKLRVPPDQADAFLVQYAATVTDDAPAPGVVELKTALFPQFLDLDLTACPAARELAPDLERLLLAVALEAWPRHATDMVLCRVGDAERPGYHVYWPRVVVDSDTALAFRARLVAQLDAQFSGLYGLPWAKIVDDCVFKGNGLRMLFSAKKPPQARVYKPWARYLLGEDGAWTRGAVPDAATPADRLGWLRLLSVRAAPDAERSAPCTLDLLDAKHLKAASALGAAQRRDPAPKLAASLEGKPVADLLACLEPQHAHVAFRDMALWRDGRCATLRTHSKRCGNVVGGEHKSCTVYFMLQRGAQPGDDGTVQQRCFCPCATTDNRKHGLCKTYHGPAMPVPAAVVDAFLGPPRAARPIELLAPPPAAATLRTDPRGLAESICAALSAAPKKKSRSGRRH